MMKRLSADTLKKKRIRAKLHGTLKRPRLAVSVSNKQVTAQLIDDNAGTTLAFASSVGQAGLKGKTMTQKAEWVGEQIAELGAKKKITVVIFDRGIHIYHGRVAALAGAARAKGLKF